MYEKERTAEKEIETESDKGKKGKVKDYGVTYPAHPDRYRNQSIRHPAGLRSIESAGRVSEMSQNEREIADRRGLDVVPESARDKQYRMKLELQAKPGCMNYRKGDGVCS